MRGAAAGLHDDLVVQRGGRGGRAARKSSNAAGSSNNFIQKKTSVGALLLRPRPCTASSTVTLCSEMAESIYLLLCSTSLVYNHLYGLLALFDIPNIASLGLNFCNFLVFYLYNNQETRKKGV